MPLEGSARGGHQGRELGPAWLGWRGPRTEDGDGAAEPWVVDYPPVDLSDRSLADAARTLAAERQPIDRTALIDLGQGDTPVVPLPRRERTLLKLEALNPTGSHKARFHAVAVAVARAASAPGVVASSTGNHGVACAAYAAAVGLQCVVVLHEDAPRAVVSQLRTHGAHAILRGGDVDALVSELVDERGWCPCTSADPRLAGRGNPYGQEGYRAIAYEIAGQLGRIPGAVAVPVASGDTYYGIWSGFRDLHESAGAPMPTIVACQPEGAAPLAASAAAGAPVRVNEPRSAALSTRDAESGWHASRAAAEDGEIVTVGEDELARELVDLGRRGFAVEPASALPTAALRRAREAGLIDDDAEAVAIVTSGATAWSEDVDGILGAPVVISDRAELLERLGESSSAAAGRPPSAVATGAGP